MSKRKYPLTAAAAMGASGTRCPQIIENPVDRRIPDKVELAEGYYILHYSQTEDGRFFKLPAGYKWSEVGDPEISYVAPTKYGTSDPEEILRREVGKFLGSNEKPKVFTITTPGGDESLYAKYANEARGAISRAFGIPEEHLLRDGRKFVYDKKASEKPEERVYDAYAWTGRRPFKPLPKMSIGEAWDEFKEVITEDLLCSNAARFLRSFVVEEAYLGEESELLSRYKIILALGRKNRRDIKRAVKWRNSTVRVRSGFARCAICFREAATNLQNFSTTLKEFNNGKTN